MLAEIQNMNETRQKGLFALMTAGVIAPLYIETEASIGGIAFVFFSLLLLIIAKSHKKVSFSNLEKGWVWVSAIYALIFVFSFLLRPPYTDDGIWRLSTPGFILVLLVWFWIAIQLQLGKFVIKTVAYTSLVFAALLLVLELYVSGGWKENYRYGVVLADLGKTGFFLPITTFLFGVLFLREKKAVYLLLYFLTFILSGFVASRSALAMIVLPLVFTVAFILFNTKFLNILQKMIILIVSLIVLSGVLYLSKNKLDETVHDYKLAEQNNFYSSMGMRVAMFEVGSEIARKHLLFGVGPNQYKKEVKEYVATTTYSDKVKSSILSFTHLHNQFLMDTVLSGIVGLVALLMFIGYPIIVLLKLFRSGNKEEAVFGIGFMAGLWFILFFGAIFTYTYTTILYVMTIGAMIYFYREDLGGKHG